MIEIVGVIAGVLAVLVAALLIYAATKPDTFRVARTTRIEAPPEKIFPLINELRSFRLWSPYEMKDPAMQRTFSGPASGKGAVYDWNGDRNVGKGRLTIADASTPNKVTINLDMLKPIEAHNIVEFTLEPKGNGTDVTWAMHGSVSYPAKVMHSIFNMDKMVGSDFETGLANLKAVAEK